MNTFWDKCEKYPPALIRMLARWPRGDLKTDEEIADGSGLDKRMVNLISHQLDWTGIDVIIMRAFMVGCGIDFEDRAKMKQVGEYWKRNPKLLHLKRDPEWRTRWDPLRKKVALIFANKDKL